MRYLSTADTRAAMPPLAEQLALAEAALVGVASGGEVPGKSAVHPRSPSAVVYAMPANMPDEIRGIPPALGVKWVTVYPENPGHGLPAIDGLILLSEPATGMNSAALAASAVTAVRTAAVSGVAIRRLLPARPPDAPPLQAALVGLGVQGRAHIPVLAHVAPGLELVLADIDPGRAEDAAGAAAALEGLGSVRTAATPREAIEGADVVVTAASFGPVRQVVELDWLTPDALMVTVDYEMYASAALARSASLFLVDEIGGFENTRHEGRFEGFPDPASTLGAFILSGAPRPPGRVLVTHLGMGLTDVVFAAAIARRAVELGIGIELPD